MIGKPIQKPTIWNRRFPTLLGLLLIVIGIGVTSYLVQIGAIPFLKAAPTENPENIRITNITDTSFSLTYSTPAQVIGSVTINKDPNIASGGQVFLDDRDQPTGIPTPYMLHSITIRNLQAKTQYYFSILSGQTTYLNNNSPFTITTGSTISDQPSSEDPLSGLIISPSSDKLSEGLVYVTIDGGQTLSALVKSSGIYIVPLNTIRTQDLTGYMKLTGDTKIQLLATDGTLTSRALILASRRNPVPTVTLSNNYDFTVNTEPLASTSALPLGFPVFALDTSIQATPKINSPTQNQNFTDSQPVLSGKALPNATVSITIHSDQGITTTVTADQYGNWSYRPTTPLTPGQHTISITTIDQFGIMKTIQQTFTILASGTQVAEAATPSASLTPTQIPTVSPTVQPTLVVTGAPSPTSAPPTLTVQPTAQSLLITSAPSKPLPPTGSNSLVTVGIVSIATTVVGILLFLSTRGAPL